MLKQYAAECSFLSLYVWHIRIGCDARTVCRAVKVGCFRAVHGRLASHMHQMAHVEKQCYVLMQVIMLLVKQVATHQTYSLMYLSWLL